MPARVKAQLAMDETLLEDADLEGALEQRQRLLEEIRGVQVDYTEADKRAKALVAEKVAVGQIARIGRFRIERKEMPGRSVSFESKGSIRTTIGVEEG